MRQLPVADPGTPDHRSPLRFMLWVARAQRRTIAGGAALGVVWMVAMGFMPAAVGKALDAVIAKDPGALTAWTGVLLALGTVQAVTGVMRHRFAVTNWLSAAYLTTQVITRQSTRLGETLARRLTTGEVVSVGLSDIARLGDAADILGRGSGSIASIVVISAVLLWMSPPLGLVVVVGVPLILLIAAPLLRPMHHRQQLAREQAGLLNQRATDIVAGLRVLRGIGGERVFAARYGAESQRLRDAGVRVAAADSLMSGAEILLPGLLIAGVTWLGAHFALSGRISPGQLVAFYGFAVFLIEPMRTVGEAADKITKGHVAAGRIIAILRLDPGQPGTGTRVPPAGSVLHDLESGLMLASGGYAALVSEDARAIAGRLGGYTPGATYGGIPLGELAGLRRRILVALNEDRLLTGPPPGAEALRAACAEDLAEAAHGENGDGITAGGREFSGGQQQRLRLARALDADPEVLILVEPTSAVDAHTEARIADRLAAARHGRTTLICTSSPLMLDRVPLILFAENGRVTAEGTHRELLATCPEYAAAVTRGEDALMAEPPARRVLAPLAPGLPSSDRRFAPHLLSPDQAAP